LKEGFHLAMAPAFFGFYGYFGVLAAWQEEEEEEEEEAGLVDDTGRRRRRIQSVAGASAGAMAAVLIAAGVEPRDAAEFCSTITVDNFADLPAWGALFRGNKFERIMDDFLRNMTKDGASLRLEGSLVPVAVSAFDIQTMSGCVLRTGSMARAARASATFPGLFQPVSWFDSSSGQDYLFIDGGLADPAGMLGLTATMNATSTSQSLQRVVNLSVGDFLGAPPGPDTFAASATTEVISVSIQNLPQPGPWAMSNGPKAFEAAVQAMRASLDVPLNSRSTNHYELHIDASSFWSQSRR
jgi:hypothetical protein